jgi:hypothetical protein
VSRGFPPPSASLSAAAEREIVRWEALWFRTYLLLFIFFPVRSFPSPASWQSAYNKLEKRFNPSTPYSRAHFNKKSSLLHMNLSDVHNV